MMNGAQLHLLLNHLPVLVPAIGALVLFVGALQKSREVQQVGLWLLVLGALGTIPAYLTGDQAEDVIKNYPGVSRLMIHDHEKAAKTALILIECVGGLSLFYLYAMWRAKQSLRSFSFAIVGLSLVAVVITARVAHLGGKIRHEEIRTYNAP